MGGVQQQLGQPQQRSLQILQALNRCTSQLDRQCQDIQQLQREFQSMTVNPLPPKNRRVYAWDNPSPLNISTSYNTARVDELFRTSTNAQNSSPFQQQFINTSNQQYRPGVMHSATSPHAFMDDTSNQYTQTDVPGGKGNVKSTYSLFGQQAGQPTNEVDVKPSDFSPFRFYDIHSTNDEAAREFFPPNSDTYKVEDGEAFAGGTKGASANYDPLVYTGTQLLLISISKSHQACTELEYIAIFFQLENLVQYRLIP